MKVVILAGGFGTRISEESDRKPKPMIEIGGKPILWHIMKHYSKYGFNEFVICAGYKAEVIKEYFHHYYLYNADTTFDLGKNAVHHHASVAEPWKVTVVDTGLNTMTGGRIKRIQKYIPYGEQFLLTYGDGVSNVDLNSLLYAHASKASVVSLTAVQNPGRFGSLDVEDGLVRSYVEKPIGDGGWINGGFFACDYQAFEYMGGDDCVWERDVLPVMAEENLLGAYKHSGFWMPMDTLRDKLNLETMWAQGAAPWRTWK